MKFKILPGCELFDKLQDINNGVIAARAAIADTLKARGFSGKFATDKDYLISCNAVEILGEKPDGWRSVGASWQKFFWPKATNKSMLKELNALPAISNDVLNNLLNFSFRSGPGLEIYYRPGVAWHKEYVLVNTDRAPYEPVEGMVEILESEYEKLYAAIKN
jgi:hypothetical protein